MDTIGKFANEGTTFLVFVLSYNEILLLGWFIGIAEAKLVKKVPIDWGFATFNFLLVVIFWYITERFVRLELATNAWGDIGYSVTFLLLGYGVYKAFLAMVKYGLPMIINGIKMGLKTLIQMIFKISLEKEDKSDKPD